MAEAILPDAAVLIEAARTAMREAQGTRRDPAKSANRALDRWAPGIDQLTDIAGAARFLGLKSVHSLRRNLWRTRADGTRAWPEPDQVFAGGFGGDTPAWTYRTIVLHRAEAPGRGHPGATLGRDYRKRVKEGGQ